MHLWSESLHWKQKTILSQDPGSKTKWMHSHQKPGSYKCWLKGLAFCVYLTFLLVQYMLHLIISVLLFEKINWDK